MAIERLEQVNRAAPQQDVMTRQKSSVSGTKTPEVVKDASAQVTLSNTASQVNSDTSRDINMERVKQIKAQIAAGEYPIDTSKIAEKLVSDIFDFS